MQVGVKVSEKVVLEMRFESVKVRDHSEVSRWSVPATRCRIRKGFLSQSGTRLEQGSVKEHVKRRRNPHFVSQSRGCKAVNALESYCEQFKVYSLLNSKPVLTYGVARHV